MIAHSRFRVAAAAAAILIPFTLPVSAQTAWSGHAAVLHQADADFDRGGEYSATRWMAGLDWLGGSPAEDGWGASLQYGYHDYDTPSLGAGLGTWWGEVHELALGASYRWSAGSDWSIRLSPTLALAGESGSDVGDSLVGGGLVAASRTFGDSLRLGFGAGVYTGLEETRVFPFLLIDWQIDQHWALRNPLRAGPLGPAGLELSYTAESGWEAGLGGVWRSFRFRLEDGNKAAPEGIVEEEGAHLFGRLSWNWGESQQISVYGGVVVGGSMEVEDRHGRLLYEDDFDPAPFAALVWETRF